MTKVQEIETQALLPISQAPYLPGVAYDEMVAANGEVRPHYRPLQARMSTLTSGELGDRQRMLERSSVQKLVEHQQKVMAAFAKAA